MQKNSQKRLVTALAGHLGMGVGLGLILGLCLVRFNIANLGDMVLSTFEPGTTLAIFVSNMAFHFGMGATLTGFVFMQMEGA